MLKNVLWITNVLIGHHREMVGLDNKVKGATWLHAAYAATLNNQDYKLHIATIDDVPRMLTGEKDGNCFYILPGNDSGNYDINSSNRIKDWQTLKEIVKPDLVVVWGTETRFAYLAMKVMKDIPKLIYMQGVIRCIADHYYEGIPNEFRFKSLRDYADRINKKSQINVFKQQIHFEEEMLKMATAVIVENDWCEDVCRGINPDLRVFRNKLPISEAFFSKRWSINKMEPHTIFTNAGGYAIKGHHILFKALAIVKSVCPDVKCYVPGVKLDVYDTFIRRSSYIMYLNYLIKEYHLENNIEYVGGLTSEQMVEYLTKSNMYVMPSVVENHSSSLIESMVVGTPSVSSLVGGVANLISHGYNGFLYNSLDANSLAGLILRVFDKSIASFLSDNCKDFRFSRMNDFGKELHEMSKTIL